MIGVIQLTLNSAAVITNAVTEQLVKVYCFLQPLQTKSWPLTLGFETTGRKKDSVDVSDLFWLEDFDFALLD